MCAAVREHAHQRTAGCDTAPRDRVPALSYLAFIADPYTVGTLVEGLNGAPVQHAKAKDILRASGLPDLPLDHGGRPLRYGPHVYAVTTLEAQIAALTGTD